jgi:peptide deformylase
MKIIKIHYKISKPVSKYKEIKKEALELKDFIVNGKFEGLYNKAFAIAHAQVSENPMAFFVVSPEVVAEKMFESQVIINPEVVEASNIMETVNPSNGNTINVSNIFEMKDACMSFAFRTPKLVKRFNKIKVKYQIKGFWGLKTIERELEGIASQIFQHETDHINGKNVYFESEKPEKWWELLGKNKSKGGNSLDTPDGVERAKDLIRDDFTNN